MELSIMLVVRNKGEVHNQGGEEGEGVICRIALESYTKPKRMGSNATIKNM